MRPFRIISTFTLVFAGLFSAAASPAMEFSSLLAACGRPNSAPDGWVRAEGLMWWTNGTDLPPLVTTSPSGTPIGEAGVLGYSTTEVLLGGDNYMGQLRGGFRVNAGIWRDCCHRFGLEGEYWNLAGDGFTTGYEGNGLPIIARPFYNVQSESQDRQMTSYPSNSSGSVRVETQDYVQSVGAWLRCGLIKPPTCCACDPCEDFCCGEPPAKLRMRRLDFLIGYRNYRLNDRLSVYEFVEASGSPASTSIQDHFRTVNDFHGTELGVEGSWSCRKWSLDLLAAMAVGNNRRVASINGSQLITLPPPLNPLRYDEGILAVGTNRGHYERDVVSVIPRFSARVGYDFTDCIRAFISYDLVYWGDVFRAADQIDTQLDTRNWPPTQQGATDYPQFLGRGSHFWAQGLSLGAEISF